MNTPKILNLCLALCFFLSPAVSHATTYDNAIDFLKKSSFRDIQDIAYAEDKPIFITFHAVWSSPCQVVDQEVFHNEKVADYMNDNFINYSANIETKVGSALAEYFDVYHLPTVLIISPKGDVIMKTSSVTTPKKFLKWARDAKDQYDASKPQKEIEVTNEESTQQIYRRTAKIKSQVTRKQHF